MVAMTAWILSTVTRIDHHCFDAAQGITELSLSMN
jgi:hypothetical protein